jgi:D-xylose transport system permease protein
MADTETRTETSAPAGFAADRVQAATLGDAVRSYLRRVRGGDMGALPAVMGLVVLFIVFTTQNDRFLSELNLTNLAIQAGPIMILAMALVPVLLMGEIDLSAGVTGGVAACSMGVLLVDKGWPWAAAVVAALVVGAFIGLVIGVLVARLGIPSFVVTLAFFLGLQGVTLKLIGQGGSVRIDQPVIAGIANSTMSVMWGWIAAAVIVVGFAAMSLRRHTRQVRAGLQHQPMAVVLAQIGVVTVITLVVVGLLNANRSVNPNFPISGIPYVIPLVIALFIALTFVLSRTRYGRHVYAVGGNAEAARRAGINVERMRVSVFMLCSSLAAISGIVAASYVGKVSSTSGAGNDLLYAVGAAVIGGTSLFGGKGRARDAIIGGLVIATIANGLGLLNKASWINFVVTGGVLLLAASVDAASRRRRSASGL